MSEAFLIAQFNEIYRFFAAGEPPLAVQLLIVNTIFLIFMIIRRMRGAPALRPDTYAIVQAVLIFANAAIIFRPEIEDYLNLQI